MVNIEAITEKAMGIISNAGMAKSCYMEALGLAKQGNYSDVDEKIGEGSKYMAESHHIHADILQQEISSEEPQISLLMAHAEDQLMGAEMLKMVILELIELHKNKQDK